MSVRTACLIIEGDSPDGEGPAAFMPVAGTPLIERVARRLAAAGLEQIVLLAPSPWPVLKRLSADLKQRGLAAPIVRNVGDLANHVRADQSLLIVQDGILPSRLMAEDAVARRSAVIYTRPVASSDDRHERIDLADRWAGLAVVPGSLVHDLDAQPDDWSAGSALLRKAVQLGIDRVALDIKRDTPRRADLLRGMADCRTAEDRMLSDYFHENSAAYPGLLPSMGKWLAWRAMPHLWHSKLSNAKLGYALLGMAGLTLLLALAGLVIPALIFGMVVLLGKEIFRHYLAFEAGRKGRTDSEAGLLTTFLLVTAVPVAAISAHGPTLTSVSAGLLLPLSLFAMNRHFTTEAGRNRQMDGLSATLLILLMIVLGIDTIAALSAASVAVLFLGLIPAIRDAVKTALTPKS